MQDGRKTIKDLFDGSKIFNIPKYQRAYAWEEEQLNAFIEDLENQKTGKDHFFGTILLRKQEPDGEFNIIDIVDGQQRITTIIIFMKLLLAQQENADNSVKLLKRIYIQDLDMYKLRVLDIDNDFFESHILGDNGSGYKAAEREVETPSQHRLLRAKKLLDGWIKAHPDKVEDFREKIGHMQVLTYSVEDDSEAALMFETTNNRGKLLTSLEKVKSFLMHKTYLASKNPEIHLRHLQNRFSKIYRDYEEIEDFRKNRGEFGKTDEDSIFQYHSIAFETWKDKEYQDSVRMINQQINDLIKTNRTADAADFINRYSRGLRRSFKFMNKLLLDRSLYLLDIHTLNRPAAFYPLLIKSYKLDDSNERQNFKRVAQLVEIIGFRFGITKSRSDKGVSQLYRLARDFNGNFKQLIKQLQEFVDWYCNDSEFERSLRQPRFYEVVDTGDQRYLFWKYENHLRLTKQPIFPEMSTETFTNEKPQTKLTIEHIIPQNSRDSKKVVADDSILSITDFEEKYLHSIGNLVLDSRSANASKSNQDFETKDEQYSKAPVKSQLELSRFCKPEPDRWNHISISDRGDKIVKFALERWNHRKPGRKPAEIEEQIHLNEEMEKIFEPLLPIEKSVQ
ncbi:MAG: DUF262 domain-containing HNH endonuclease family protein [Candidatus Poribacteria bacterium]|nr:DUF262 domain-containing HNH endonuclease family protein [Candidatus Poribacteria bacterium]